VVVYEEAARGASCLLAFCYPALADGIP